VNFRITAASIALMGMCVAQSTFGQAPQAQPAAPKAGPSSIALVDVGYILKNHPTMDSSMKALQGEMQKAQEDIESRRKSLLSETENVAKSFNQDSPEFKQKQEFLISQESKLRVDFMGKEKEFAEKQAGVIYQSYQQINQAISVVAKHYNYDLILRYSREQNEMNPKEPKTVNFGIQRDVLFHNPQVDVTDLVMSVLGSSVGAAPAPNGGSVAPVNGQGTRSANGQSGTPQVRR
jgi:Skp family chaperone for outer membrane proteins